MRASVRTRGGDDTVLPKLFEYQVQGVQLLTTGLRDLHSGMVLADVMGLGKTLQGLLVAIDVCHGRENSNVLIVAPRSAVPMWKALVGQVFHKVPGHVGVFKPASVDAPVCPITLTTPGILRKHVSRFHVPWGIMVIDEAHDMLNEGTRIFRVALSVSRCWATNVLLLTGTPISPSQPARSLSALFALLKHPRSDLHSRKFWQDALSKPGGEALVAECLEAIMVRRTHAMIGCGTEKSGSGSGSGSEPVLVVSESESESVPKLKLDSDSDSDSELESKSKSDTDTENPRFDPPVSACTATLVEVPMTKDEECEYLEPAHKLERLLPMLLDMMHLKHPTAQQELVRQRMLKSSFELIRKCQAVCWASARASFMQGVVAELRKDLSAGRGVFVTCFWKTPLELLMQEFAPPDTAEPVPVPVPKRRKVSDEPQECVYISGASSIADRARAVAWVAAQKTRVVLMTAACALSVTFVALDTVYVLGACLDLNQQDQAIARVVGRVGQTSHVQVKTFYSTFRGLPTVQHSIRDVHRERTSRKDAMLAQECGLPPQSFVSSNSSLLSRVLSHVRAVL